VIGVKIFGPLPLWGHLRFVWKLLPPNVVVCVPPFMQFIKGD
jgi:hypothetical protein